MVFTQGLLYTRRCTDCAPSAFKYGMYAVANVFWDITPRIELGTEFDWARRVNINGEGANAHRVGVSAAFSF